MVALHEVADVLGMGGPRRGGWSPLYLVTQIERGLPVGALERVADAVAPGDAAFKYRIVPRANLARRKHARRLSPDESGRLARLAGIWSFARSVWGGDQEARAFLFRPHPLLEERTPIDLVIASELGAQLVEDILGRLAFGSAV